MLLRRTREMPGSTIIIGDIHGNSIELKNLLLKLWSYLTPATTVVFLGDYIDNGLDSKGVLNQLILFNNEHPGKVVFLKGNHEQWLVKSLKNPVEHSWLLSMRGLSTIKSYSQDLEKYFRKQMKETGPALIIDHLPLPYDLFLKELPDDHLDFLYRLDTYFENDDCICSHAGVS